MTTTKHTPINLATETETKGVETIKHQFILYPGRRILSDHFDGIFSEHPSLQIETHALHSNKTSYEQKTFVKFRVCVTIENLEYWYKLIKEKSYNVIDVLGKEQTYSLPTLHEVLELEITEEESNLGRFYLDYEHYSSGGLRMVYEYHSTSFDLSDFIKSIREFIDKEIEAKKIYDEKYL